MDKIQRKRGRPKENSPVPVYQTSPELNELDAEKYKLLAPWQKNLIARMVEHRDLDKAARETGVGRYVKDVVNTRLPRLDTIRAALTSGGITAGEIVRHLKECLEGVTTKIDKNNNPFTSVDHRLKLKAIEIICRLRGEFSDMADDGQKDKKVMELFKIDDKDL